MTDNKMLTLREFLDIRYADSIGNDDGRGEIDIGYRNALMKFIEECEECEEGLPADHGGVTYAYQDWLWADDEFNADSAD